jgi:predicted RNA-binding protein with PIN domain
VTELEDGAAAETERDQPAFALPDVVRGRVVGLCADALGRLPAEQLPPSLKRVASFAPGRRVKLAGAQIAAAVETDAQFRERIAGQVRMDASALANALEAGTTPAAADPVEVAAIAYLLRPDAWTDLVDSASRSVAAEREARAGRETAEQVERVRRQLEAAQEELKKLRAEHRAEVARLKAENSELRHKLGDARSKARSAEASAARAADDAEEIRQAAATAASAAEADLRRSRSRIEQLESELAGQRRIERVGKGAETMRARLLLDTLLESIQGLRRELALPAVEGAPADLVEAHVAEEGSRASSGHGSMAVDDPALLESLLTLPRSHLVVDGYNVTKTSWPELPLEQQRDRLVGALAPLAGRTSAEVTVVFDAADKKERPLVNRPRNVRVLFSPVGIIADDVIRELVAAEPQGRPVVVVTSDQAVARDVQRDGARVAAAAALARLLQRA